jgi:hypothetical protein
MRILRLLALVVGALAILAPATAASGSSTGTVYTFALVGPNTTVAPADSMMALRGDWITLTGGGTFLPAVSTVQASGAFVHYRQDGTVHCKGRWRATELTGWTDFGGSTAGRHGGVLSLLVTHSCQTMGMVHAGVPMTVTSTLYAPADSAYVEGTTTAGFTEPTAGSVTIQRGG